MPSRQHSLQQINVKSIDNHEEAKVTGQEKVVSNKVGSKLNVLSAARQAEEFKQHELREKKASTVIVTEHSSPDFLGEDGAAEQVNTEQAAQVMPVAMKDARSVFNNMPAKIKA